MTKSTGKRITRNTKPIGYNEGNESPQPQQHARTAERLNELRLTILNHYQKVAQTILITYSHYANLVIQRKATDESHL